MRRRILIVSDEMEVGGTQRQIVELARSLKGSQFDVSVAYFRNPSRLIEELHEAGIPVTAIGKRHRVDPVFFYRLCRFVRKGDFDLIHAFSFSGELWSWLANAISGRARFVGSIRGVYRWYRPWQWWIKRWITRHSFAVIANSQAGAEYAALQMAIRRSSIDVVYNSVPSAKSPDSHQEESIEVGLGSAMTQRILFVGRLDQVKNLPCLFRAVRRLIKRMPQIRVDIVGDGPERKHLQNMCAQLGLVGFVNFHGVCKELSNFHKKADVFVLPSFSEGFSNALVEAMHARCAVVASNTGGNAELIEHERTGMLFPSDDDEVLADMLRELLTDDALRQRFGRSARESVRQFADTRRMRNAMIEIYERCLVEQSHWLVER